MKPIRLIVIIICLIVGATNFAEAQANYDFSKIKRENLGRGVFAVRKSNTSIFISWRYLSADPINCAFNLYRNGSKIATIPAGKGTYYEDNSTALNTSYTYEVRQVIDNNETGFKNGSYTIKENSPIGYLDIPMQKPAGGTVAGSTYTYFPGDATVGDLDGDGEYEIILKWDPSNTKDNANSGASGNVIIDAYKIDGTRLWRIDLGQNIRAGSHYTQLVVADFDGNGIAELMVKTADGTIDGKGNVIGDATKVYRNGSGYILTGPEFLTVFSGRTGEALKTVNYVPSRGNVSDWGDNYGNRVDRFLACTGYVGNENGNPSAIFCRGYYTRATLVAWDWDGTNLTQRWFFDSNNPGYNSYTGQGNHNLIVGDVDGDGYDEIMYGSCAIDHDGKGLYSTGWRHGDAMHMSVMDPRKREFQIFQCHESGPYGSTYRNAATGELIFGYPAGGADVGRCMSGDVDPRHPGVEMCANAGTRNIKGEGIATSGFGSSFGFYWTGSLNRQMLSGTGASQWNYATANTTSVFSATGCSSINSTKANPSLAADILGDWREEALYPTSDGNNLRLFMTTYTTDYRFHCFMEDPVYRHSVAYQNTAYNQPTNNGFYFGSDLQNLFPSKKINYYSKNVTITCPYDFDNFQWRLVAKDSVISNGRSAVLKSDFVPLNQPFELECSIIFRGQVMKDIATVTLISSEDDPLVWNGSGNTWGTTQEAFGFDNEKTVFSMGRSVILDDQGTGNNIINKEGTLDPQFLIVDRADYTLQGSGKLSGNINLAIQPQASLTLTTENEHTGTLRLFGSLITKEITNGGVAGSFGAASANAENIIADGGYLSILQTSSSDRMATVEDGGITINTPTEGSRITWGGFASGDKPGNVSKTGIGELILTKASDKFSGDFYFGEGTLTVGAAVNGLFGTTTSRIYLNGAKLNFGTLSNTISIPNDIYLLNDTSYMSMGNLLLGPINSNTDQVLFVNLSTARGYTKGGSNWTSGTIIDKSWTSKFLGKIIFTTNTTGTFIASNSSDYGQAKIFLGKNVSFVHQPNASKLDKNTNYFPSKPTMIKIGELSGEKGSQLHGGRIGGMDRIIVCELGALNTSSTFDGDIVVSGLDAWEGQPVLSISKVGTGTLRLNGNNTYIGGTRITGGKLIVNGRITSSAPFTVNSSATLAGLGTVTSDITVSGTLEPGDTILGAFTAQNNLTFNTGTNSLRLCIRSANEYSRVVVGKTLSVSSTRLYVTLDGYNPKNGDVFQLWDAESKSGNFSIQTLPTLPNGFEWDRSTLNTDGKLKVTQTSGIEQGSKNTPSTAYILNGELHVKLEKAIETKTILELYNINAAVVNQWELPAGCQSFTTPVSLNRGIYILKSKSLEIKPIKIIY